MKIINSLMLITVLSLLTVLTGCSGEEKEDGIEAVEGINISMKVDGVLTNSLPLSKEGKITIIVLDDKLIPVTGGIVTLTTGLGHFESSTVLLDAVGRAEVSLFPPSSITGSKQAGSLSVSMSALGEGDDLSSTFNFEVTSENEENTVSNSAYQAKFSLSANVLNPEAFSHVGEEVIITATLAKQNGNPVQEITTINFEAEDGTIDSACTTSNGSCSVTWKSTNNPNKPTDHRVTILAYTSGSETFTDANADNIYQTTDGEPFDNRGSSGLRATYVNTLGGSENRRLLTVNERFDEPFVDDNTNGVYDEPFIDSDGDGSYDLGEQFEDYNKDGKRNGSPTNIAGENTFIDLNKDGVYQGSGSVVSEGFVDNNPANNQYDVAEHHFDRSDLYKHQQGIYDSAYVNDTDGDGTPDTGFVNPVNSASINLPVTRGEDFTDVNANGLFDGEGFEDLAEPFLDKNEDGVRQANEKYIDTNGDGIYSARNEKYDGINCHSGDSLCGNSSIHIRRALTLVTASSTPNVVVRIAGGNATGCTVGDVVLTTIPSSIPLSGCGLTGVGYPNAGSVSFSVYVSDTADQTMPMGTIINLYSEVGSSTDTSLIISNSNRDSGSYLTITVQDVDPTLSEPESGRLVINVISGIKNIFTRFYLEFSGN